MDQRFSCVLLVHVYLRLRCDQWELVNQRLRCEQLEPDHYQQNLAREQRTETPTHDARYQMGNQVMDQRHYEERIQCSSEIPIVKFHDPLTSARDGVAVRAYAPHRSSRVSPHRGVFTQQQPQTWTSGRTDMCGDDVTNGNIPAWKSYGGENVVESWIDDLNFTQNIERELKRDAVSQEMLMAWLVQQHLPQIQLPKFDGEALDWVDFIMKFRDIVHNQEHLSDNQKFQLLLQHLTGEARRAVRGFSNDTRGYVMSLKKLKYLFGQRPRIAQAVLDKITKGKVIQNDDVKGLTELSYSINECLVTLEQLNYVADLRSSDTLRQVVRRLPSNMLKRWAEHSLLIRQQDEPNLAHLDEWLQKRVLALKETYLPKSSQMRKEERLACMMVM